MGNCLSTCTSRSPGQNGEEVVISYSGGKLIQTPKDPSPQIEKDPKEFSIVQKELEALQTQISHSQAVLASLKFTFYETTLVRGSSEKVHRTTQTLQDAGYPKSLEDVPSTVRVKEEQELARSCPAIASIAVQTEVVSSRLLQQSFKENSEEKEYFLPPIESSHERHKDQVPISVQTGLDLDIYSPIPFIYQYLLNLLACIRSCRKLSVLPEEETDESPPSKPVPSARFDQAHSFDSYLIPATSPSVVRQLSDPTPSVRRPLQVTTLLEIVPSGVEDSGLGSELRLVSSPSPTTPCYKTPPLTPSSDQSLSWQTPNSDSESPEPPEKQLLSVLIDPGGCLAPEPLVRVPSRRRLVRSLARIGSEAPESLDIPSESPPRPENMNEASEKEDVSESNQQVFPNLTDADLKRLGLWVEPNDESEPMDDENIQLVNQDPPAMKTDLQLDKINLFFKPDHKTLVVKENPPRKLYTSLSKNKYTSLVLAFKTDKMTLSRRLELQNKLRDQAEINMTHEVETLKSAIQLLSTLGAEIGRTDLFEKIRIQIEALYKSALRVSSTAEMYGAVQQENRLSKAVDIILRYVENLKQIYEKEKTEHEETRKLLRESKTSCSTPTEITKRRASMSTFQQQSLMDLSPQPNERRGSTSRRGSQLRRSTLSKNDSQTDILRNGAEGDPYDKIYEGCETCGSRLRPDLDSNPSQPNSSDESSTEDTRLFKRSTSFKEETVTRKVTVNRQKFRKRTSFSAPLWFTKSFQWLRPYEDYAMQVRYFIASLFVAAAFLIVAASFFQSSD